MNKAIKRAMVHSDVLGAGAKKRRQLKRKKDKFEAVMAEYKVLYGAVLVIK
jgi:hypothetical protein